jgi:hypothetical protein
VPAYSIAHSLITVKPLLARQRSTLLRRMTHCPDALDEALRRWDCAAMLCARTRFAIKPFLRFGRL